MLPDSIKKFIEIFSKFPGIGKRAATRLVFFVINLDRQTLDEIISAINNLKKINRCKKCFFIKESAQTICGICSNKNRDEKIIAIVEKETDLLTIEKTGKFNGTYLILGELNERGIIGTAERLRLQHLKTRIKNELNGKINEIIIAINPGVLSELIYEMVSQEFNELAGKITRLGRGIPTGGEIEFADEETLQNALERRT